MRKTYKLALMAGVGMLGVALSSNAFAFHDGGVAHCDGCHTMHNSSNGVQMAVGGAGTVGNGVNSELTKGSDPSSTCLNCHKGTVGSYHVLSTDPLNTDAATKAEPGGDFYWLSTDVPMSRGTSLKDNHGHNVVAADFGLTADAVLGAGPSDGSVVYNKSWLGCNSCHDPHGHKDNNVNPKPIEGSGSTGAAIVDVGNAVKGNFRLLGGVGYDGGKQATGISFTAGDPVAVSATGKDSLTSHTDYGSGMSEWCVNCHSGFTTPDTSSAHRHPAGAGATLSAGIQANYNSYITTGNMTHVGATGAYDNMVPFERGVLSAGNDGVPDAVGVGAGKLSIANTEGVDGNSTVMCLTCHRAHASAFDNIGRWNFGNTFLMEEEANAITAGFTVKELFNGNDMTRYAAGDLQRSLCNKCHAQD